MYPEVRLTLVVLAVALAALPAWWAGRIVSRNLVVLSAWKRSEGVVTSLAADDQVEVEIQGNANAPRVNVPVDHQIGLSFLKRVPLYVDPADPKQMRLGGLFQMWLWPAGLMMAGLVLLIGMAGVASIGRGATGDISEATGHWHFTSPPPPLDSDIHVRRPASELRAPLFWSLLGVAALALAVFVRAGTPIQRAVLGGIGTLFILSMCALALNNRTTEVSADRSRLRKTTAFGWCQTSWDQVGSVERQRTIFGRPASMLRKNTSDTFAGREVTLIVFADRSGHALVTMSQFMQPPKQMLRLMDLCTERTGLHIEFRTIYERNL